jgi:hypothetical protein
MIRTIRMTLAAALWLSAQAAFAQQSTDPLAPVTDDAVEPCTCCVDGCCGEPTCATCCPCVPCQEVCCPTVYPETEERSCWNVKCKKVCVPAIRFPWEGGCHHNRLLDCLCRLCCGCCGCAVCGDSKMAANCCDGCSPPLVLPECGDGCCSDCGCRGCCECCSCCQSRCGYVRCVNVLEENKYEVTRCKCKWEVRRLPCCHDGCGCAVDCPSCGDCDIYFDDEAQPLSDYVESAE